MEGNDAYEGALDWEGEVSDEGGFVLLEPGVYPFVITKLEKERYEGGRNIGPCPRAKLTLSILSERPATVFDRIMLHTRTQWRVAQLFESLGFARNPETGRFPMAWNQVEGAGGYVELKVREYESQGEKRKSNEVARYLPPSEWPAQDAAPAPAPQPAYQPPLATAPQAPQRGQAAGSAPWSM